MLHLIFILSLLLFNGFLLYPTEAKTNSFSFDLIHHDSKSSPFYNQSMTKSERSKEARIRSLNRLNNHMNSSMLADAKYSESDLTIGDYFMNIYISDPEKRRLAFPSMSVGLTWMRCGPCSECKGNTDESPYDPKSSKTHGDILFDSKECKDLGGTKRTNSKLCEYEYHYGHNDRVFSGVLGTETFYLRTPSNKEESFSHIVFGCDEAHKVHFKKGVQGFVGLGHGPFSLVSQVGKTVGKKFSYCLVEKSFDIPSKIKFGRDLRLYSKREYKVKVRPSPYHDGYYLGLEAISVNDEKIETTNKIDMMVDIQTALTSLPSGIYNIFMAKFKKQFADDITTVIEPNYGTCFITREIAGAKRPKVVFHFSSPFASYGDFPVNRATMFEEKGDFMCLTIVPTDEQVGVLGNKAQVDVQMIFDLSSHSLTFSPTNCLSIV